MDLGPLSLPERAGLGLQAASHWLVEVLNAPENPPDLRQRSRAPRETPLDTVFDILWRGGYPRTLDHANEVLPDLFASYVRTYVERDIRILADVRDQQLFARFLAVCATMTAQEINYSQIGRDIGITPQTADRWLQTLKATFQWVEAPPYHGNTMKRVSGKPRGYFSDTGLAAFLQRISSPVALSGHPSLGALFETHVVMDIHHLFSSMSLPPWRITGVRTAERKSIFCWSATAGSGPSKSNVPRVSPQATQLGFARFV